MSAQASGGGLGFLMVLGIVFIVLKLCGVIGWPWLVVLIPILIDVALAAVVLVVVLIGLAIAVGIAVFGSGS